MEDFRLESVDTASESAPSKVLSAFCHMTKRGETGGRFDDYLCVVFINLQPADVINI